jgi:hypothetical protein
MCWDNNRACGNSLCAKTTTTITWCDITTIALARCLVLILILILALALALALSLALALALALALDLDLYGSLALRLYGCTPNCL